MVAGGHAARQVFDLPERITLEVTEYRAHTGTCPRCGKKVRAVFPAGVRAPVQYGARVRAVATYLHAYQFLPCERLGELLADLFGHRIGTATAGRLLLDGGDQAAGVVEGIREKIRGAPFIHCDETGPSLCDRNIWLHTAATPELTYLHVNEHRGLPALREVRVQCLSLKIPPPEFPGAATQVESGLESSPPPRYRPVCRFFSSLA